MTSAPSSRDRTNLEYLSNVVQLPPAEGEEQRGILILLGRRRRIPAGRGRAHLIPPLHYTREMCSLFAVKN
jgi:hypothetical protein